MEFITKNLFNTTTSISVTSGTLSAGNILGRNSTIQYVSDGFNNDLTTSTIVITFDQTTSVSRIGMLGINWKDFTVFHSGVTASTLSMTSTGATTTSDWSSNSETSMYIQFATVQASSISFDVLSTQSANAEKAIGHLYIADILVNFETQGRVPSSKNYKPKLIPKQIEHKLSDGGVRTHTVDEKFSATIKYKNIETSFRDSLKTVWSLRSSFGFVAFPTTTSWDEVFFEANWTGAFTGYEFSDDAAAAGHSISISLKEAPRR